VSLKISHLNVYPIKSCAGMAVSDFVIGEEGAEIPLSTGTVMDRGWMFVNPNGDFQTQRALPQMALLKPVIEDGKFFLLVGSDQFEIPLSLQQPERKHVQVWSKQLAAALVPGDVSRAASEALKTQVELVYFDSHCKRETLVKGKGTGVGTRFTDSQPYLLISEESLQDLNSKMKTPVGRERFRANIWISGAQYPYREDQYSQLDHADFSLEPTKPCARCKIITVDELLGKVVDSEPLKILAQFRRRETQVYFGQYFLSRQFGASIRVGDALMPSGFMKEPL
jgi:hypothetical protein